MKKVAGGNWPASIASKFASWKPQRARFVRLEATKIVEDNNGSNCGAAIAEIEVSTTPLGLGSALPDDVAGLR